MEGPDTRIVGDKLNDCVPSPTDLDRVSSLRVFGVYDTAAVPSPLAFGDNPEIVPVEMHRLGISELAELLLGVIQFMGRRTLTCERLVLSSESLLRMSRTDEAVPKL